MKRRRPRGLSPEESELWRTVAGTVTPLRSCPVRATEPSELKTDAPRDPAPPKRMAPVKKTRPDPPPASPPAPPPLQMDAKTHARMRRGKLAPEARIDLHGMTLAEAHPRLTAFLLDAHSRGLRLVLVITGKGRGAAEAPFGLERPGVLRRQLPHWLQLPPLGAIVLQMTEAHLRHGGGGAFYVYLRRSR